MAWLRGGRKYLVVVVLACAGVVCGVSAVASDVPPLVPQPGGDPPPGVGPEDAPGASEAGRATLVEFAQRAAREKEEQEQYLASDGAVAERLRSQTAHADASAEQAAALVSSDFGALLTAGSFDVATLSEGASAVRFLDDRTLQVDRPGTAEDVLVDSSLPLRAEGKDGIERPVSLAIERDGGSYVAANPLVDVAMPEHLEEGLQVGAMRVSVETREGAAGGTAQPLDAVDGLLYHEADVDTDVALVPVPTGLETAWLLRSPEAGDEQRLRFELPDGGELIPAPDGGVDVVRGEERLGRVLPPYAVDAQGKEVMVTYEVDGSALVVRAEHRREDVAYPVLVDPLIQDWLGPSQTYSWYHGYNYAGIGYWYWQSNQAVYGQPYAPRTDCYTPVSCYKPAGTAVPPYGRGLYTYVFPGPQQVPGGTFGEWVYDAPGSTTEITQATLGPNFAQRRSASLSPYAFMGIWAEGLNDWTALAGYQTIDVSGVFSTLNAGSHLPNSGANQVAVGYFAPSTVTLPAWRDFAVGGARITMTDPENPTVSAVGLSGPSGWVNGGGYTVAPTATDPGLGIKSLTLTAPKTGGTVTQTRTHGCTGLNVNPCPASWTLPQGITTAFGFTVADADPNVAGNQPMPEGVNTVSVVAKDVLLKSSSTATTTVKVDRGAPSLTLSGGLWDERESTPPPSAGVPLEEGTFHLDIEATDPAAGPAPQGTRSGVVKIEVEVDGQPVDVEESPCAPGNCPLTHSWELDTAELDPGRRTVEVIATDGAGNEDSEQFTIFVPVHPPDAPPLPENDVAPIHQATEFIYSGPSPLQTGVAPGTIKPERSAVIRGRVADSAGNALGEVQVSVPDHPEYGTTETRGDGEFYLAVNGGGPLTIRLEHAGHLSVDRLVDVPWQDYVWADDVVMTELDPNANAIDLSTPLSPVQVARGSVETDADGSRRATLIFPADTSAELVMPNGTELPLDELTVRATEYTVGEDGEKAMPAELPPTSGYTYAAEYSVDEAIAAGASEVRFSRPVVNYTENFLGFPVGGVVPTGYYDRERRAWISAPNGLVVEILSETAGVADIDLAGSGQPATSQELEALGVTAGELAALADLYAPGDTLWRVAMEHFTPWDHNWPWAPAPDAERPEIDLPPTPPDRSCTSGGSVIECENQVLGEDLPVTGSEQGVHYRSDRVPGRAAARTLDIPLIGDDVPASLTRIDLTIDLAGRRYRQNFQPTQGLAHAFVWDGRDSFGRMVTGAQQASIQIDYVYDLIEYLEPAAWGRAWSRAGLPLRIGERAQEIRLSQSITATVGSVQESPTDLGGWSLSSHHRYDPAGRVLYLGDGRRRSADNIGLLASRFAGKFGSPEESTGDGGPAREATFAYPEDLDVGPDGSVYFTDSNNARIRRIDPEGTIETIAGTGEFRDYGSPAGDGGPATAAELDYPYGLDVGADGSVYFTDWRRVRKIDPDGTITTVAGNEIDSNDPTFGGDGGPATDAHFDGLDAIAVAPDGSFYVLDYNDHRVRHVGTDGIVETIAGTGIEGFSGDGGPATQARLDSPEALEIAPDGGVYVVDSGNDRVRRIGTDGVIDTVVGGGIGRDGVLASQSAVDAEGMTVASDGTLLLADAGSVYHVNGEGMVRRIAGDPCSGSCSPADSLDASLAADADIGCPVALAAGEDRGEIYAADLCWHTIRRLGSALPGFDSTDIAIPSEDGSEIYEFDGTGQHLRTIDALTGGTLQSFAHDGQGRILGVEDGDGLETAVERDPAGAPTAIVAPFGQRTDLSRDQDGYLSEIANPANEATTLGYASGGLLTSLSTPEDHETTFAYDSAGRLTRDTDSATGFKELTRVSADDRTEVTLTTKLGRSSKYEIERLANDDVRRTWTDPSNLERSLTIQKDGALVGSSADGVATERESGPDPRFGAQAPISKSRVTETPGGKRLEVQAGRDAVLADPGEPLSLTTLSESLSVNGRETTTVFDSALSQFTSTSPEGRTLTTTVDSQRRPVSSAILGLTPVTYTRDANGLLEQIAQGARSVDVDHDSAGRLQTVTDALDREHSFEYDAADRVVAEVLPDQREIGFAYDDDGNLTSVTPPSRPAHGFASTPLGQADSYTPPDLGSGPQPTTYDWSDDRELTQILKPGGRVVEFDYDAGGRLETVSHSGGETEYGYDAQTGKPAFTETDSGERTSFAWDGFLPLSETASGTVSGVVSRTYDNDFEVVSETINSGHTVAYDYDDDGLLVEVGGLMLERHASNGLLTGSEQGVVETMIDRDDFGDPESVGSVAGSTVVYKEDYERDDLGRIVEKVEWRGMQDTVYEYGYDIGGRLETVTKDGVLAVTYDYDANGNRTGVNRTGDPPVVAQYDAQDRLTDYGAVEYGYDPSGQLTSKVDGADTTTYDYDDLGTLRGVALPNGDEIAYTVDASGRRLAKKIDGVLTQGFLYGRGLGPAAELNGAGNVVSRFVYGTRSNVPEYMVRGGQTYRILVDQLGSPRAVIDVSTGVVAQQMDFDEFGRVTHDTNPGFQPFGFAGGLYDAGTGLVRFGARDYDPETGRWTAKDPIGFGGGDANLYGYVLSDPVNWNDPTGLFLSEIAGGIDAVTPDVISNGSAGVLDALSFGGASAAFGVEGWCGAPGYGTGTFLGNLNPRGLAARGARSVAAIGRYDQDQDALIQIAKDAKRRGGISEGDMETLKVWGREYGVPARGPEAHPGRGYGSAPHGHVGPVGHIPIRGR
jgi:RHS repeat-associated protein